MPETYTFELTFTGLCIFTFTGKDRRKPTRVDALLVNALHHAGSHRHVPLLGFDTRNVEKVSPAGYGISPGPDGRLLGRKSLIDSEPLEIEVRKFALPALEAVWRPDASDLPEHPDLSDRSEEEWLDWAMSLQRMNPETVDPKDDDPPYNGLKPHISHGGGTMASMSGAVKITGGVLKARGFLMDWDADDARWRYALWTFKEPDSTRDGNPAGTHTMAASVVLSIPGIPVSSAVVLKDGNDFEVWLAPRRELDARYQTLVQASVTNLPEVDDGSGNQPEYLVHFKHFYEPVDFGGNPPGTLRLPHPVGHTITLVGSFCPPTTHTEGS